MNFDDINLQLQIEHEREVKSLWARIRGFQGQIDNMAKEYLDLSIKKYEPPVFQLSPSESLTALQSLYDEEKKKKREAAEKKKREAAEKKLNAAEFKMSVQEKTLKGMGENCEEARKTCEIASGKIENYLTCMKEQKKVIERLLQEKMDFYKRYTDAANRHNELHHIVAWLKSGNIEGAAELAFRTTTAPIVVVPYE
jgi:uncharacterized coiled-coil protein SlyX